MQSDYHEVYCCCCSLQVELSLIALSCALNSSFLKSDLVKFINCLLDSGLPLATITTTVVTVASARPIADATIEHRVPAIEKCVDYFSDSRP